MRGFSLIELSISLLIITLILSSGVMALSGQKEMEQSRQIKKELENVKEALYGFALTHGRLPCPANEMGVENCALRHGFLPAETLGVPALDLWGNRLRYFVHPAFSAPLLENEECSFNLSTGGKDDDAVRKTLPDIFETTNGVKLVTGAAAVIWSYGKSGKRFRHADENSNEADNLVFIHRPPTDDFDDIVEWISPFVLKAKLLSAGKLP